MKSDPKVSLVPQVHPDSPVTKERKDQESPVPRVTWGPRDDRDLTEKVASRDQKEKLDLNQRLVSLHHPLPFVTLY